MQIPKSGKFLLVKSRILCFGFRYPAKGNQNHANDCNPEYKFHWQGIPNPESRIQFHGTRNLRREIQRPRLSWIPSHGARYKTQNWQRRLPSPGLVTMAIMTRFQSSYPGLELTEQCPSMERGREGPPITLTGTFNLVSGHSLHAALRFNVFILVR